MPWLPPNVHCPNLCSFLKAGVLAAPVVPYGVERACHRALSVLASLLQLCPEARPGSNPGDAPELKLSATLLLPVQASVLRSAQVILQKGKAPPWDCLLSGSNHERFHCIFHKPSYNYLSVTWLTMSILHYRKELEKTGLLENVLLEHASPAITTNRCFGWSLLPHAPCPRPRLHTGQQLLSPWLPTPTPLPDPGETAYSFQRVLTFTM